MINFTILICYQIFNLKVIKGSTNNIIRITFKKLREQAKELIRKKKNLHQHLVCSETCRLKWSVKKATTTYMQYLLENQEENAKLQNSSKL